MRFFILLLFIPIFSNAKMTIESEGKKYNCTPQETCEDKVKRLEAKIAKLEKQLKEKKEVVVDNVVEKEVIVEKELRHDNILSLYAVDSQDGLETNKGSTSTTVDTKRKLGAGAMYQRRFDDLYVGVGADTNSAFKITLGVGF